MPQKENKGTAVHSETFFAERDATVDLANDIMGYAKQRFLESYPNANLNESLFIAMYGLIGPLETAETLIYMG